MKHLRFSYAVLVVCAGLVLYGLVIGTGRTSAVFVDVRVATGLVDAGVAFPPSETPTVAIATSEALATTSPQATKTHERTPAPVRTSPLGTASPEQTASQIGTASPEQTVPPSTPQPTETAAPDETVEPEETTAPDATPDNSTPAAEETSHAEDDNATAAAEASPSPQPMSTRTPQPESTLPANTPGATTTAASGSCADQSASIAFGEERIFSGPSPLNIAMLVVNHGASPAGEVALGLSVIEGGEFLNEVVFTNSQMWWAHGQSNAGVLYAIPNIGSGQSVTIGLIANMESSWTQGARTVIRVSVVDAECAAGTSDVALLTLTFPYRANSVASASGGTTTPAPTIAATLVGTATPVQSVLGIQQEPTALSQPTGTAPSGRVLPSTGDGGFAATSATKLMLLGLGLAIACLAAGAFVGRRFACDG